MATFQTITRKKPLPLPYPNYEQKIRDSFKHQGTMKVVGGELVAIGPGYVEVHFPATEVMMQQHGFFHGGMVTMAADTASGYATYSVLEEDEECLSAEFKVNFLAPARGEKLISRGSVIKVGRTLVIAEATVSVVRDGEEHDCALMLHTLARVKHVKSGQGFKS